MPNLTVQAGPGAMVERVHSTTVAVMPTSIFGLSFEAKALCEPCSNGIPRRLFYELLPKPLTPAGW